MKPAALTLPFLVLSLAAAADPAPPTSGLDLSGITLTPLYETNFAAPLRLVEEDSLFYEGKRIRDPGSAEWVLEGSARAELKDGRLHLVNEGGHLVCWNTRPFPSDFLLEFGVIPENPNEGLNIVFFCATGREGGGLFDLDQPWRHGEFKTYHSGGLNSYHASYWATQRDGTPRGTAHIRKNHGFHLVAEGPDLLAGTGPGPHRVRVFKMGGEIAVEVNGRLSVRWHDDGETLGPVLRGGLIGLRQMEYTKSSAYTHFKVWSVSRPGGPDVTAADVAGIPRDELEDSLHVVRGKALFINLAKAKTSADWRQIPGVKGAWSKSGLGRGMTTLQDADGDGQFELYGEGGSGGGGKTLFSCREADGTARWKTAIHRSGPDNNGVQCEDLDGDGAFEAVSVGPWLQILDARTGALKVERFIFSDFHGSAPGVAKGTEMRFDSPYRPATLTKDKKRHIVIANGWSPAGPETLIRPDGKPDTPKGGIQIVAYRPDGSIAWHYQHAGKNYRGSAHEFRTHDLDGDGLDEIVYSANGGLVVLNPDGSERWRKDDLGEHSDWIPIADVTGDGRLDIVVQQGGAKGFVYIYDALTGEEKSRTADALLSQLQNLAHGHFLPDRPGRQIALTTINGAVLRLLDGPTGELLPWATNAAEWSALLRWNDLDMYNCTAHDADGDGLDEIFTYSTPKGGQLVRVNKEEITSDSTRALHTGVAAFGGDGTLKQYWNFYTPIAEGVIWGTSQVEMRQFHSPGRRWDLDGNGIEEAYIETEDWILLVEIADLAKPSAPSD